MKIDNSQEQLVKYYAHIADDDRKQTVNEHLLNTANMSSQFAEEFGFGEQGYLIGLTHDIGKYSSEFQKRLQGGPRVDHSTAGAIVCREKGQIPASFCVIGHHSGLPDAGYSTELVGSSWFARINRANELPCYEAYKSEIGIPEIEQYCPQGSMRDVFLTRMLYSCLVDADYLDTEKFMFSGDKEIERGIPFDAELLNERFDNYVTPWFPPRGELNKKRCEILKNCINTGESTERGLFTLTVPTGGGKTISSLAFALRHAKAQGMRRVIYVVPYTSIIEQNAEVLRKVLGSENVLEHYSGVDLFEMEESTQENKLKIRATENWDMPVIITTAVQFFESFYSNKPSKCRKLHNVANSVVIFDEAQMLPMNYLRSCVHVIAELVKKYRVSAVLCTATQPSLSKVFSEFGQFSAKEICPAELSSDVIFERTVISDEGTVGQQELIKRLSKENQVLCIVNARKDAQTIYKGILEEGQSEGAYHLSTLMTPVHRKSTIAEIKERLNSQLPCRVVSTSLIEAGVDVDFPVVFKEENGLDSIMQAAGRCNREGRMAETGEMGRVFVYRSENQVPSIFSPQIAAKREAVKKCESMQSGDTIQAYFDSLISIRGFEALDRKNIVELLTEESTLFPFQTVADRFKLIEEDTKTIYIPTPENEHLIERVRENRYSRRDIREIGKYGVAVYENHYKKLYEAGAIEVRDNDIYILEDISLYDDKTGLSLYPESGQALFI